MSKRKRKQIFGCVDTKVGSYVFARSTEEATEKFNKLRTLTGHELLPIRYMSSYGRRSRLLRSRPKWTFGEMEPGDIRRTPMMRGYSVLIENTKTEVPGQKFPHITYKLIYVDLENGK